MSDPPLARPVELDSHLLVAFAATLLFVVAACDDEPDSVATPEPVGPQVDQLQQQVDSLADTVSETIETHQPDTGLTLEQDRDSNE